MGVKMKIKKNKMRYKVSEGEFEIYLDIDYETDEVKILNECQEEKFVFSSNWTVERMEKWEKVIKLMNRALEIINKEFK